MKNPLEERINQMKQQTIGVEVEMVINRKRACQTIAQLFDRQNTVYYEGTCYQTWTCKDQKGRTWKFMRDSSIETDIEDDKCELVTPILHYEDIELLQEVIRTLRKAGAKSNYELDCGVHIHIGADINKPNGHTPSTLRNLTNIMASHEELIIKALGIARERTQRWCKTVNPNFLRKLNSRKPKTMDDFYNIWYSTNQNNSYDTRWEHYNSSRYHILNFHATYTKGTIEFRAFQFDAPSNGKQNGLHAGKLKAYIQLCLALSQMAKEVRGASPKQPQYDNPKYAMRTWLLRLGFIGEEFKTAREVLTERLEGDASFRYGRPNIQASL